MRPMSRKPKHPSEGPFGYLRTLTSQINEHRSRRGSQHDTHRSVVSKSHRSNKGVFPSPHLTGNCIGFAEPDNWIGRPNLRSFGVKFGPKESMKCLINPSDPLK